MPLTKSSQTSKKATREKMMKIKSRRRMKKKGKRRIVRKKVTREMKTMPKCLINEVIS